MITKAIPVNIAESLRAEVLQDEDTAILAWSGQGEYMMIRSALARKSPNIKYLNNKPIVRLGEMTDTAGTNATVYEIGEQPHVHSHN